jgi:amidohydrolase
MIQDGCLEGPYVERVYGLHVMPYLPVGFVELKKGVLCGSSATLTLRIHGKSAHGAYPETGIDAVLIAANVVLSLNTLVSRYVSPLEQAVITVGTIHGGVTSNILASQVEMRVTLRTTSNLVRETLVQRIRAIVEGIPLTFGGSGELDVSYGYEALVNHDEAVDEIQAVATTLLGPERITWKEKPSMGVEDFSFLVKARPGAFYHLGCGNPEKGITAPLHSAAFDIDEDCLVYGTAMQAGLALAYLQEGVHP